MNQSVLFSKRSVSMVAFLLLGLGFGGMPLDSMTPEVRAAGTEEIGWFNPDQEGGSAIKTTNPIRLMSNEERIAPAKRKNVAQRSKKVALRQGETFDEDLSWVAEEEADFSFSQAQTESATAEILPPEAIRNVASEKNAAPISAGDSTPDNKKFFEGMTGEPTFTVPNEPVKPNGPKGQPETPLRKGPELKQAATQIDRFGNIGHLDNVSNRRTDEGGLVGNPYANGVFEYHPRSFAVDPSLQTRTREVPPCESFGTDAYGNDCVGYADYGCDGACCEYCYDGCDGSCCNACGGCGGYYDACGYSCYGGCCGCFYHLWSMLYPALQHSEISAGVFGYQDPFKMDGNSDFGVDLAFNWTMPKKIFGLIGQAGGRYTRSGEENSLSGEEDYHRSQFFWTSGLFYRQPGERWQIGAVYDSLRDDANWTYTVGQVRTELSYRLTEETSVGFRGAFHMDEKLLNFVVRDKDFSRSVSVQTYYTGFVRHTFVTGAEGMISAGMTEENETLIGGRLEVPVTNHSCIRNSFVYVFPKDKSHDDAMSDTWSASISWVVYLGGNSRFGLVNPFKPLFDVADNTTLLQKAE